MHDLDFEGSGYFWSIVTSVRESTFQSKVSHICHDGLVAWDGQGITLKANTVRDNRGANLEVNGDSSFLNNVEGENAFAPLAAGQPEP